VVARVDGEVPAGVLEAGIRPTQRAGDLAKLGISGNVDAEARVAVIDLVSPGRDTEYWLGYENFWVITRYNRSSFYAMSVFQLAEEIRNHYRHP
jgi:membrane-bound lytic murein transglycosylase B